MRIQSIVGQASDGIRTSYAADPLNKEIQPGTDPIPVWPLKGGDDRGIAIIPLYPQLPLAALEDPALYKACALFDALRTGRARERNLAKKALTEALSN